MQIDASMQLLDVWMNFLPTIPCDHKDTLTRRLVCRRWSKLIRLPVVSVGGGRADSLFDSGLLPALLEATRRFKIGQVATDRVKQMLFLLERNTTIETLDLVSSGVPKAEFGEEIGDLLRKNSTLRALKLISCSLASEGALRIAEGLRVNSSLTKINLMRASIDAAGFLAIAAMLKDNATLRHLSFSFVRSICAKGATALAEAISSTKTLQTIYMNSCSPGPETASIIICSLEKNSTLTNFSFNTASLSGQHYVELASALKANKSLRTLSLCTMATDKLDLSVDDPAATIGHLVQENDHLETLKLFAFPQGAAGLVDLFRALRFNRTLKRLLLDENSRMDTAIAELAELLLVNLSLTEISLRCSDVSDAGAKALAEALKLNKTLQFLNLNSTEITDAGAAHLIDSLRANPFARVVSIRRTRVSARMSEAFERQVELISGGLEIADKIDKRLATNRAAVLAARASRNRNK